MKKINKIMELYLQLSEEEKLEFSKKIENTKELMNFTNSEGKPYFHIEYIIKNYLKL